MEVWCQFFSSGFFGYGEKGNFKYWSFAHFAPIILLIAAIYLIFRFRKQLREWKHEETFRFIFAFVMLMVEMSYFWRLLYVGSSDPTEQHLLDKLPLQVCEWTCIIACFMLMKKSNNLYQICFFVSLSAGIFPLVTPAVIVTTGPAYYRYYQFWLEHILPIIAVFYMTFVHGSRAHFKGIFYAVGMLGVLAVFSIIANIKVPGTNYMYLATSTDGDSIVNFLPENIWVRLALFSVVIFSLFIGIYYLSRFIDNKSKQRCLAKATEAGTAQPEASEAPVEINAEEENTNAKDGE